MDILIITTSIKTLKLKTGLLLVFVFLFSVLPVSAGINQWTGNGPEGGYIYSFVISPDYTNDSTVFLSTAGSIYKSTNRGQNWMRVNNGLSAYALFIYSLAISPEYANDSTVFAGANCGVYKSIDRGLSWTLVYAVSGSNSVAISPNYANDLTVFAGTTPNGVYKSTDGGQTWTQINDGLAYTFVESVAVSPNYANDSTVFAALGYGGIYKSTDGGQSWIQIHEGGQSSWVFNSISISPNYANDSTVFAVVPDGEVWKSTNGGLSWTISHVGGLYGAYGISSVAVSPNYANDSTIYVGAATNFPGRSIYNGVWKSTDGGSSYGSSWIQVNSGLTNTLVTAVAISPDYAGDTTVFAGTDGSGAFKSTDGGQDWTHISSDIKEADVTSLAVSPNFANDSTVLAGTRGGTFKSTDGGQNWTYTGLAGLLVVFSPNYANDRTVFAGTWKSTDGGQNWTQTGHSVTCISPDYANDRTIFSGSSKSTDGGQTWTQYDVTSGCTVISPNYANDLTIFGPRTYKSINDGKHWTQMNIYFEHPDTTYVQTMNISPNYVNDSTLFAGTNNEGIYKSINAGQDWTHMIAGIENENIKSFALSHNFATDATIFAGTRGAVYKSTDGGQTWAQNGLTDMIVNSVAVAPNYANNPTVFAGTHSAGVFSYTLVDTTPPATTASPPGGTYSRALVTLTCTDDVGSGCDKIYYTLDGSVPTTNSPIYSRPINISTATILQFFAIDRAGNEEDVKTEVYSVESIPQWIKTYRVPGSTPGAGLTLPIYIKQTSDDGYIVIARRTMNGISKLDSNGNVQWYKTYGDIWSGAIKVIQQTTDGGYIGAGITVSDAWLLKLDGDGNIQWQKTYGESGNDYATFVQQTSDNGYVMAGFTDSFGAGNGDAWVLKLDEGGNIQWQKAYGGALDDYAKSIEQTSDGGYIMSGCTPSGDWVLKLDADGAVQWQKTYGGRWRDFISAQQTPDGGYSAFSPKGVIKLDGNGNIQWERLYYSTSSPDRYSIESAQQTSDGGYIIAGIFTDFTRIYNVPDAWLMKLDSVGRIQWQRTYGGTGIWHNYHDTARSVAQTSDGGFVVAGDTDSLNIPVVNSFDEAVDELWILKLESDGVIPGCLLMETSYASAQEHVIHSEALDTAIIVTDTNAFPWTISVVKRDENLHVNEICHSTMALFSPDGGEAILCGSAYSIDWWAPPEAVKFDVGYSLNSAPWKLIAKDVVGYSYNWITPILANNEEKVRVGIRGYDALARVTGTDTSNSPFALEVVNVTHPNGGEFLYSGKVYTIRWESNQTVRPVSSVKIYGSPNDGAPGTWKLLTTIQGNPGYWDWVVPSVTIPKTRCRVGVVLLDSASTNIGQDASDANFIIQHVP